MASTVSLADARACGEVHACGAALGLESVAATQYYEFRLGTGADQADYLLAVGRRDASELRDRLVAKHVPWAPLIRLSRSWADQRSPLAAVPFVWLEFDDTASIVPLVTPPSVSVCLIPGYTPKRPLGPEPPEKALALARLALHALAVPVSPAELVALTDSFTKLPAGGQVIHLSVMLGRTPAAVKLYGSIPRSALLDYLRRVDFRGDLPEIAWALDHLYDRDLVGNEVFIDLNLHNLRDPATCTLGLAAAQQHVLRGPDRDASRARLLERCTAAGLIDRTKLPPLRNWIASEQRFLDVKLVWQSGRGWTAKAYLGQRQPDERMRLMAEYVACLTDQGRNRLARTGDPAQHPGEIAP